MTRIEQALMSALATVDAGGCPPKLASALRYAVFPGGARIRPRLCLAVAMANDPTAVKSSPERGVEAVSETGKAMNHEP